MFTFLSLSITVLLALLLRKYITSREQYRPYPPGPKPRPIVGNALDHPTKDLANVYIEWGKKYNSELTDLFCTNTNIWFLGSILHATALGTHVVVLNKLEDADELFKKRAKIYSDRPQYPILKL